MNKTYLSKDGIEPVEALEGIFRKTLVYNKDIMLCHFLLHKGAKVPVHSHKEHQVGYILSGKLRFITENDDFVLQEGDSYIFDSNKKHGAIILEESEVIDVFNPSREDYK